MRSWNGTRTLIYAACFLGATACSDDDGASAGAGAQSGAGAAGAASANGGGSSLGGSANGGRGGTAAGSSGTAGAAGAAGVGETPAAGALGFEADVLPILSQNCMPCHTGDGFAGHDVGGPLPGSYNDALRLGRTLLDRVSGEGSTGGMPPGCVEPGTAPCLSVAQVQTIADWLEQGSLP